MTERQKNITLCIVATVLSYLALELLAWRPNLQMVPLSLRQQLGFLDILAQPSKRSTVPEPGYVAIVGDSYAEGLGDWMMRMVYNGNPDINAGDILHRTTGRDVLSFGYRGGHPAWTFSYEMTAAVDGINRYSGLHLPPAGDVIAYFYEGNDINDLMSMLNFSRPAWVDPDKIGEAETARRWIDELGESGHRRAYQRWWFLANAHMADTAGHLIKLAWKNASRNTGQLLAAEDSSYRRVGAYQENWGRYEQSKYFVYAGGKRVPYPSPTVESFVFHDEQEIAIAGTYFRESLHYLKTLFPGARILAVYIPSPINVYPLAQPDIPVQDRIRQSGNREVGGSVVNIPAEALLKVSNATCESIHRASAAEEGVRFIDTRAGLRAAAATVGYLHGPNDPGHLNQAGYSALAEILKSALAAGDSGTCAALSVHPAG